MHEVTCARSPRLLTANHRYVRTTADSSLRKMTESGGFIVYLYFQCVYYPFLPIGRFTTNAPKSETVSYKTAPQVVVGDTFFFRRFVFSPLSFPPPPTPETKPINIISIGILCVGKNNQRQHYVVLFRVDLYSFLDITTSTCVKKKNVCFELSRAGLMTGQRRRVAEKDKFSLVLEFQKNLDKLSINSNLKNENQFFLNFITLPVKNIQKNIICKQLQYKSNNKPAYRQRKTLSKLLEENRN